MNPTPYEDPHSPMEPWVPAAVYGPDDSDRCDGPPPPVRIETLAAMLDLITGDGRDPHATHSRAMLLSYHIAAPRAPKSLRELGECIGISHAAAAKRLTNVTRLIEEIRSSRRIG